jgi:hypothetical protein
MSAYRLSLLIGVVAAALVLGVGAARADGPPLVIPVDTQFPTENPCTGEIVTVSLTGELRLHQFYNEAGDVHHWNVSAVLDGETSDGFVGKDIEESIHNAEGPFAPREEESRGMEVELQNGIARNPETGQVLRLHTTLLLVYASQEENVVETTSVTLECLGTA